jgi:DNA-binding NarL/FixJ family response regulator
LSTEQLRVLLLTANGKRTKGIARELHVSERTVEPRLKEVREKLRVETKAQAVAQAMKNRLIRADDR